MDQWNEYSFIYIWTCWKGRQRNKKNIIYTLRVTKLLLRRQLYTTRRERSKKFQGLNWEIVQWSIIYTCYPDRFTILSKFERGVRWYQRERKIISGSTLPRFISDTYWTWYHRYKHWTELLSLSLTRSLAGSHSPSIFKAVRIPTTITSAETRSVR